MAHDDPRRLRASDLVKSSPPDIMIPRCLWASGPMVSSPPFKAFTALRRFLLPRAVRRIFFPATQLILVQSGFGFSDVFHIFIRTVVFR